MGISTNQFATVLKTVDRINWTTSLPPQLSNISSGPWDSRHPLAISTTRNSSGHKTYYAAAFSFNGVFVNVSEDDGATWTIAGSLSGSTGVNGVAVDTSNSEHVVVGTSGAAGDNVFVSSDGGKTWAQVTDSGPALPRGSVRNVAFDPTNSNVIYVAHQVGVFKGTLSGTTVSWTTFNEGLPNGIDVHDIAVDPATGTLTIGTYGYGAYTRNVNSTTCPGTRLIVRDNVFDQGQSPSPSGVPDPEHHIADPTQLGFFKADDTTGGEVYFWDSTDVRIDIPSQHTGDPAHQIAQADSVEFETCPVEKGSNVEACPVDTMVDTNRVRGSSANAYVQVANEGLQQSSDVRVITLFVDATLQVPNLPSDFWDTT
ncbi:MAG: WD40/YVTN/BNR-like repeat-containing protein, partial [Polyangiaceae bacterium]